jgi:protein SCO1
MRGAILLLIGMLAVGAGAAVAQDLGPAPGERVGSLAPSASQMPELLQDVGLDQKLNAQVPLDLKFRDEEGRPVTLGQYFGKRPVILTLNYYECPMLCTEVLNGLVSALGVMNFSVGKEFDVVTVSFDPRDTPTLAKQKKTAYLGRYKRAGADAGWHFLTGSPHEIAVLTRAVGFRYAYNEKAGQFAHASGVMVATPEGRLSHYFYGIEYGPRDLRLALVEASNHKIGNAVDQVLLACFHYDLSSGRYSLTVMTIVRAAGLATVALIAGAIIVMRRRERKGPLPSNAHA